MIKFLLLIAIQLCSLTQLMGAEQVDTFNSHLSVNESAGKALTHAAEPNSRQAFFNRAPLDSLGDGINKLRLKPFVQVGFNLETPIAFEKNVGRADRFEKLVSPVVFAGVHLDNLSASNQLSFDLAIGYNKGKTTIHARHEDPEYLTSGSETLRESTIILPLFVNYRFYNTSKITGYVGVGGVFERTKQQMDYTIMDYTIKYSSFTWLIYDGFVERKKQAISPSLKLGLHWNDNRKIKLFTELHNTFQSKVYSVDLLSDSSIHSRMMTSVLFGIKF